MLAVACDDGRSGTVWNCTRQGELESGGWGKDRPVVVQMREREVPEELARQSHRTGLLPEHDLGSLFNSCAKDDKTVLFVPCRAWLYLTCQVYGHCCGEISERTLANRFEG